MLLLLLLVVVLSLRSPTTIYKYIFQSYVLSLSFCCSYFSDECLFQAQHVLAHKKGERTERLSEGMKDVWIAIISLFLFILFFFDLNFIFADDDFVESNGVKRIIQALHAHTWPNLKLKSMH